MIHCALYVKIVGQTEPIKIMGVLHFVRVPSYILQLYVFALNFQDIAPLYNVEE